MKDLPNASPEDTLGISFEEFVEILDEIEGKRKVVDEANGGLRSLIKAKLSSMKWNKNGLAMIRTLRAMSPSQRADVLRTFKPMFDLMLERKWADEMRDLVPDRDAEDGDGED